MYLTELGLYQHETGQSEFTVLFIVGGRVGDKLTIQLLEALCLY